MLNIFNLFLFLLALWILFMVAGENISALYVFYGVMAAGLVSFASFKLKLVEEKSELLYLSIGFHRHFLKIFLKNFLSAVKLVCSLALAREPSHPLVYVVRIDEKNHFNIALLMASFNMSTGLFCIGVKDNEVLVHSIDEEHFKRFNLQRMCKSLNNVNDDNLV